ncbi:terminase large subunit [Clostridium sporogenes]|uniref:terminase large subunit n=1 Tax=Clostridium sporogenes TaxID=1509 RepID=UPI001969CABC|nr:terminase TerL endonuclease subunit [Clostridium sporogenes]
MTPERKTSLLNSVDKYLKDVAEGKIIDRATLYCLDVLEGKIIAGEYVKLACKRHINDLKKSKLNVLKEPFEYYWDVTESQRIIEFAETLIIDEGEEKQPLVLRPFQCFILGSLMGWYNNNGYRRFRDCYIQLGRQNGKSLLNGILATYMGGFDGYRNGRIITCATKADQAKIVWDEIVKFIGADEDLAEAFKVYTDRKIISYGTGTEIYYIGRDTKSMDGFRSYLTVIDELHAHKNNQMYKLAKGGQRKLKQCLTSAITTAGFDLKSFCKEHYDFCVKILEGIHQKEATFIYIAQMDKEDIKGENIWNWENWGKANPLNLFNADGSYDMEAIKILKDEAKEAKIKRGKDLIDFMTKALNVWVEFSERQFAKSSDVLNCECDLTLEEMRGKPCGIGLDLSSGGDLTSLALEFELEEGEYFIHTHSFMPSNRLLEHETTDEAPYRIWVNDGLITLTETLGGIKTDYKYIIAYLRELIEKYELKPQYVAYDPHNADAFLSDLEEIADPIMITQSCKSLNDATVDIGLLIEGHKLKYNRKSKLLRWSFANAKLTYNSFKERKIDKDLTENRIDPCDAVIDAHKVMFKQEKQSDINKNVEEYLEMFKDD